jgi:antitoxin VapB
MMDKAYIFMHGRSQAVRLPKAYRFKDTDVTIEHFAGGVLLLPKERFFGNICAALDCLEADFKVKRDQPIQQIRAEIKP